MRIIILATAALSIINITQAAYTIKIPFEQAQGGALPNGSINITPRTPLLPVEPLLGEWVDKGSPTGCTAWTPLPDTVKKDQPFEQSSTCSQEQTRTVEEQVKNMTTGVISKTGNKSEESKYVSVVKKQSALGTKAVVKQCVYGATWGNGFWSEYTNNTVFLRWYGPSAEANEIVTKTLEGHPTSYTQDGYTYSRGNLYLYSDINYYICRE